MAEQQRNGPGPRPAVVHPPSGAEDRSAAVRVAIDRAGTGCRNLEQRIIRQAAGSRRVVHHDGSEEIAYVISGRGTATLAGDVRPLRPGTGLLVPEGTECVIDSTGDVPLELLSVLTPQPGSDTGPEPAADMAPPAFTVHADDQETIPAGSDEGRGLMDRHFKLMIDPTRGARYVTQFIGFIERSRAPLHTHTYEEVIYILDGSGVVHVDGGQQAIGPGTSIYLPAGAPHCLENPGEEPLQLVGVFCPAGSPAARRPAEEPAG